MSTKLLLTVLCLFLSMQSNSQDYVSLYSQDFESTAEFGLPPGWSQINFTNPQGPSYANGETGNLAGSLELAGWTVLNSDQLMALGSEHLSVPDVVHGKSVFAYSDYRSGIQIDYLYTPVFDFRNQKGIRISFDSNYTQNQDSLAFAEYTLQGNLANDNPDKKWLPLFYWSDSPEVDSINGDVTAYFSNSGLNDDGNYLYINYIGADISLIDPALHIRGCYNDDQTSSKARETFILPKAAGGQYVQIRFFYGGGSSWYWGIDDFLIEGTNQEPISIPTPTPTPSPTPTLVRPTLPPGGSSYVYDFEGDNFSGWSSNSVTVSPNGVRKFLGEFDNPTVTLTLENLPIHRSVTVSLDLLILKSWDGEGTNGPDIWDFTVDGKTTLLHTTFDNILGDTGKQQNFPDNYPGPTHPVRTGAVEQDTLGYTFYGDATYHLEYAIPHTGASLQLAFRGENLQGISDESWGIDNVKVQLSSQYVGPIEPTPTATPTPEPILYGAEITEVSVQTAPAGTPVELKGSAFWLNKDGLAANVPVKIRILLRGVSRFLSVVTDASGRFSTVFQPLPEEAGKYSVNANHPQIIDIDDIPQKEFVLVGMRMDPRQAQYNLIPYTKVEASFALINMGDTELTGITAKAIGAPANLQVAANAPTALSAEGRGDVAFSLNALDNSTPTAAMQLQISSAEGAVVTIPIEVAIAPGSPRLTANPGSLQTGMLRGAKTLVECEIVNTGGAVAKNVQVMLPQASWLALVTSPRMGDIAPGESGKIVLALTPSSTQKLGLLKGSIVVYGEQVDVTVPFQFNTISDAVGDLKVWVEDEFTYYAAGSPRVADATVTLKNNLGEIVAEVASNAEGIALIPSVKEGDYYLQVWAAKHNTYNNTIHIEPGKINEVRALLPRDLVTYRWKVVPTLIQDHYEFTVESVFETNVPVPVVTIDPPVFNLDSIEGDTYQLDLTITNHGLIQAEDINLEIGTHPLFEMTLFTNHLDKLAANSSVVVPISFRRITSAAKVRPQAEIESPDPCTRTFCLTRYGYECGKDRIMRQVPMTIYYFNVNVCGCQGPACGIPTATGPGGTGPGTSTYTGPGVPGVVQEDFVVGNGVPCNPCLMALGEAGIDCFLEKIILNALGVTDIGKCGWKVLKGTYKSYSTCSEQGLDWKCLKELAKAGGDIAAACGKAAGKTIGKPILLIWDIVKCADKLYSAYDKKCRDLAAKIFTRMKDAGYSVSPASSYSSLDTAMEQFGKDLNDLRSLRDALVEFFGDPIWIQIPPEESDLLTGWLEMFDTVTLAESEEGESISASEKSTLLAMPLPSTITQENAEAFIERWNRSIQYWKSGIFEESNVPTGQDANFIVQSRLVAAWQAIELAAEDNELSGNDEFFSAIQKSYDNLQKKYEKAMSDEEEGVCARVRIRIEQEAVMTRSAFLAILELDNNSEISLLENVNVTISIRDASGDVRNERFGIKDPVLSGISSMDGTGSVQPRTTARAEWTLIPANDAAPEGPTQYFVGGQLSYRMEGNDVTVQLFPDSITVMPDPRLIVKYYHQKDVYSDDPFTAEVEPAEPFTLGLMMTNIGKGIAKDMQITSSQPQIVDNEKGLIIDFSIIGTQVGEEEITPSLKVNLGDIEPGKSAVARWLLVSTLQGKFVDYQATYEHIDGMNNPKLSLIDSVEIHELIHVVRVDRPQDDRLPDFLVNDAADDDNLPDTIHSSEGNLLPVQVVREAQTTGTPRADMVEMKVKAAMPQGWVYLRINDPSTNQHTLVQVLREDGSEVRVSDNAWTTHRVKRPKGQAAYNEDFFHLVDYVAAAKEVTYTLVFQPGKVASATPTPTTEPMLTPMPTPEFAAPTPTTIVPGVTPTPTNPGSVGPTNTPIPWETIPAEPMTVFEFDKSSLNEDGWAEILGGFQGATPGTTLPYAFYPGLFVSSADQKGLVVAIKSGEVTFLAAREPIQTGNAPVLIRARFRSDGSNAQVVLGALKGSIFTGQNLDGSIACSMYMSAGSFTGRESQITVVYYPDSGEIITPFIQIAGVAGKQVNVWIDRLDIFALAPNAIYPGELFGDLR